MNKPLLNRTGHDIVQMSGSVAQSYITFVNDNFMGLVAHFVIIERCLKAYGSDDQSTFVNMNQFHLVSFYPFFIVINLLISLHLDRAYTY